jgi:hypothetical protein
VKVVSRSTWRHQNGAVLGRLQAASRCQAARLFRVPESLLRSFDFQPHFSLAAVVVFRTSKYWCILPMELRLNAGAAIWLDNIHWREMKVNRNTVYIATCTVMKYVWRNTSAKDGEWFISKHFCGHTLNFTHFCPSAVFILITLCSGKCEIKRDHFFAGGRCWGISDIKPCSSFDQVTYTMNAKGWKKS